MPDKVEYYQEPQVPMSQTSTFYVELSTIEANAIMKLLPKGYIFHLDRSKARKNLKKNTGDKKIEDPAKVNSSETQSINEPLQYLPSVEIQTMPYEEMLRRANKILNLLRKNKNSWPFREPVDPISMGIPQYFTIIQNPMDLKTMEENLLNRKYNTVSQFYADVQLIINNSYSFNKNNADFNALTADFEKYFEKIKGELPSTSIVAPPTHQTESKVEITESIPAPIKQKSVSRTSGIEISHRKELALKLKGLPKEELTYVVTKMNENGEKSHELNLQTLPEDKIRYLQDYFHKKESETSMTISKAKVPTKKAVLNEESSFESDSDS